jgi:hypothetical protein
MSAAETIQAAIEKLERLRDSSSPAPWIADEDTLYTTEKWKNAYGRVMPRPIFMAEGNYVSGYAYIEADAELILTLHRTIDAQLSALEAAKWLLGQKMFPLNYTHAATASIIRLAEAIVGEDA